ncbi:helix-turn-helix transcriptional regulator [Solibacillus sp. FSL H8-0538]|uniref:helix-turn-helix transcriptional regulator n=1 Tax=Solibacillus sp. FSL H8-0538 TaxID=2921400 RepID=UPI0030F95F2D
MDLLNYVPFVGFLAHFLGPDVEIRLSDAEKEEVVYAHPSDISKGSSILEIEKRFIEEERYKERDSVIDYRALSVDGKKLKSATHFIKNHNNQLLGLLTINYPVDELIEFRNMLNNLISGYRTKEENYFESVTLSVEELMTNTIQDAVNKFKVPASRLSYEEKMKLIQTLDEKGTFLIKGSVTELAKILNTSETTVYRYINKL